MKKEASIHVRLPTDMVDELERAKQSSGYVSNSEIVREALRDWQLKMAQQDAQLEAIRNSCLTAMDEINEGNGIAITNEKDLDAFAEKIKKQGRKRLAALNTK